MEPVDFVYHTKEYYYKNILIFTTSSVSDMKNDDESYKKLFLKMCRDKHFYRHKLEELSDKELLDGMIIKELPKPQTFPQFSNEKPFKIKWNGSYIHNPKIIGIRWSGYEWQYKIKNIGHIYDYQPERFLEKML